MNKVTSSTNIPPKVGIAMGFITSLPVPVAHIIGSSAATVVTVVMINGLILLEPASMMLCFKPSQSVGAFFLIPC